MIEYLYGCWIFCILALLFYILVRLRKLLWAEYLLRGQSKLFYANFNICFWFSSTRCSTKRNRRLPEQAGPRPLQHKTMDWVSCFESFRKGQQTFMFYIWLSSPSLFLLVALLLFRIAAVLCVLDWRSNHSNTKRTSWSATEIRRRSERSQLRATKLILRIAMWFVYKLPVADGAFAGNRIKLSFHSS